MSLNKVKESKDFVINRISRLYPTYWVCVTLTFILISIISILNKTEIPVVQYLGNMTMFQYYLRIPDLDEPYWTMIVEMVFYICVLFLFHYRLLKHTVSIGLIVSLSAVASGVLLPESYSKIIFKLIPLLGFAPLFLAGILFYKIYTGSEKIKNYLILIACLLCQTILYTYSGKSRFYITQGEYALMLIIYFVLFVLFVNNKLRSIVSKTSLFFGKISFALYLIHQKISIDILMPILTMKYHLNFWVAAILITLPIVIGLAIIITYYIEIPLSQKMKLKLKALMS